MRSTGVLGGLLVVFGMGCTSTRGPEADAPQAYVEEAAVPSVEQPEAATDKLATDSARPAATEKHGLLTLLTLGVAVMETLSTNTASVCSTRECLLTSIADKTAEL